MVKIKKTSIAMVLVYVLTILFMFEVGNIKYVYAALCSAWFFFEGIRKRRTIKNFIFKEEFGRLVFVLCVFCVITIIKQIINGFNLYFLNEIVYFITPLVFSFTMIQLFETEGDVDRLLGGFFYLLIGVFFIKAWGVFSLDMIKNISFSNSESVMEGTGLAFLLVPLIIYFYFRKDYKRELIALLFVFLCLKRLSFVLGAVICLLSFLDFKKKKQNRLVKDGFYNFTILFFILVPIVTYFLLSDSTVAWFRDVTGLDINLFTMGRFERLELVTEANAGAMGWGATTTFLTNHFINTYLNTQHTNFNLHNDIYKVFIENGIIGTIVFTYNYFKITNKNYYAFLLIGYLFLEMFVNHDMGAGTTHIWVLVYLLVFRLNESKWKIKQEYD